MSKQAKKNTMNRMHSRPDVKKMIKCINSGSIAGLRQVETLSPTKKKITIVLEKNRLGIALEKFGTAFEEEFGEWLRPSMFGFSDLVEMLKSLHDIVDMKLTGSNKQMLLFPKSGISKDPDTSKNTTTTEMREEVIDTFRAIITSLGGISVDILIPEYESRTNQKLNLQKLGFDSFPHFLSHLSEVFKTCKREGQVFLLDPATPTIGMLKDSQELTSTPAEEMSRTFNVQTTVNLRKLLEEEFPFGLQLNELYAAYEGFYGSSHEDLNYEKHGYGSLEAFLGANTDVVSLHRHQGSVCVLPCQPLQHPNSEQVNLGNRSGDMTSDILRLREVTYIRQPITQINLSYTGSVVSQSESYTLVERLPAGKVQVVVGEVYTPKHFWVMHYGDHHSKQLDKLMDGMLEFYSSSLGNRYKFSQRRITNQMVLAALYPNDQNFYRAFVISMEDLTTVKLFFVDYGTVWVSSVHYLRLLHKNFFALPAQAIKCSLHGIVPANGKRSWGRACSSRLLDLVQNQRLVAEVVCEEMTTVIKLWDTSQGNDINIGDLLVRDGLVNSSCSPGYLEHSNHTLEARASSPVTTLKIQDGESHIESSSCSLNPEEVLQQEEDSSEAELLDAHCTNNNNNNTTTTTSLPHTRSAASSLDHSTLDCSQTVRCHSVLNSEMPLATEAGGRQLFMASTPMEKEVVTVGYSPTLSNDIFISDEEFPEDLAEGDELNHSFLIQPVEVSFNKKINVIQIGGVKYVLNIEFPHMESKVYDLGVTLNKGIDQDIYNFLIESGCDVYEPSGEVRSTLVLYPLSRMAAILAQNGYSITSPRRPNMKWSHKDDSSELLKGGKDSESVRVPYMNHSTSSNVSSSSKTYRHGAQVDPLRKPNSIKKFGPWRPVADVTQDTRHQ